MNSRVVTAVLIVGLAFSFLTVTQQLGSWHLPGNQQGYEPVQPIAFSHRLHAGEMQISCLYCHSGAEVSRHAGIPAASTCMNCHRFVSAPLGALRAEDEKAKQENRRPRPLVSPEIQKIYDALALDDHLTRDPQKFLQPVAWTRINRLPDFVYFNHSAHVNSGVACQKCHGPIETMDRVRQAPDLTMGWCVNCHRTANAAGVASRPVQPSTDCSTCHY
jgi:hypothetical protein